MRKLIAFVVVTIFMLAITLSSGLAWTGSADLKVTGSGLATGFGLQANYSGTLKNKGGPDTATNVVVTGGIAGGSIAGVSTSQGTVTISGDSFTIAVGSLAPGATVSISFSGNIPSGIPSGTTYCGGHLSVTATESDPNPGNNVVQMCVIAP